MAHGVLFPDTLTTSQQRSPSAVVETRSTYQQIFPGGNEGSPMNSCPLVSEKQPRFQSGPFTAAPTVQSRFKKHKPSCNCCVTREAGIASSQTIREQGTLPPGKRPTVTPPHGNGYSPSDKPPNALTLTIKQLATNHSISRTSRNHRFSM